MVWFLRYIESFLLSALDWTRLCNLFLHGIDDNKYKYAKPLSYFFNFKKAPDQTVTELFGHNTDAKWANILYVGQIPDKDIQSLEKNTRLHNKVKKAIDNAGEIQFKNEIFSITKIR